MMYTLINVSWRICRRTNVSKTEGVHSFCCGFLSKKIKIWQKIIFNAENNWLWTNRTILSHMAVNIRHGRLAGYLTAIHHPEITVERGSREILNRISVGHFEVLTGSVPQLVQKLWHKTQIYFSWLGYTHEMINDRFFTPSSQFSAIGEVTNRQALLWRLFSPNS